MSFKFDQPSTPMPADPDMTFDAAGDLKFSDLGPTRVETDEGNERRRAADAEATWTSRCHECGDNLSGTLAELKAHECEP